MRQQLGAHALAQQVAQRVVPAAVQQVLDGQQQMVLPASAQPQAGRRAQRFQIISLARSSPAASGSDKDRLTLRRRWPAGWMPVMHALSPYKALMPLWATSGTSFWRSSCARAWPCSMMMAEKRGVMKDVAS